jgi:ATP-binding cassette subfamily F protein uup
MQSPLLDQHPPGDPGRFSLDRQLAQLHEQMTAVASNYQRLAAPQREIELITGNKDQLESAWLQAAAVAG